MRSNLLQLPPKSIFLNRFLILFLFYFTANLAFADYTDIDYNGLKYDLYTANRTATCKGLTNGGRGSGNLVIPDYVEYEGNQYSVTTIGDNAFYNCSGFTGSLTIGNSVTTIGDNAFIYCFGFTGSLTIGNSVTTIGDHAFSHCSGFTGSLTIGNAVTTISERAFNGCSGFTGSLTIPNSVITIDSYAFTGCSGFTGSLTIGNSVTTIGYAAFWECSGFTGSLTIPNSVITIGEAAFSECSGFTGSLTIGSSVNSIGSGAFGRISKIDNVISQNPNPPQFGNAGAFSNTNIPLYVPDESVDLYKNARIWKNFNSILGISEIDAPNSISLNPSSVELEIGKTQQLSAVWEPSSAATTITWTSSDTRIASVSNTGLVTAVAKGSATITATTSNGKTATSSVTVVAPQPTNVTLSPSSLSLIEGATGQLTANLTPSNAETTLTWKSNDTGVATVDQSGKVTSVKKGTATITVSTANGKTAQATVNVSAPEPTNVTLSPSSLSLIEGATGQLTANLTPSNAETTLTWKSNDTGIATVDQSGKVTAVKKGSTTITVSTANGKTATATVTVSAPEPANVTLSPSSLSLIEGATGQLTANLTPSNAETTLTWKSNNTGIATVDQSGKVTAVKKGTATITVSTANGKTAQATVTVSAPEPTNVTLSPSSLSLIEGATGQLTANLTPSNAETTLTWRSNDTGIATVDQSGKVTAVKKGTATITVSTANGKTAQATVTVSAPEPTNVTLSPSSLALKEGETGQLNATLTPSNAETTFSWSSDKTNVATVDQNGKVTAISEGSTTITVKTSNGKTATATVTVSKNIIEVTNITVSPTTAQVTIGSTVNLTATVTPDNATDKSVSWSSSDTKVATVSETGVVTGVTKGNVTITATASNGKTATSAISVVAPEPTNVSLTPTSLDLKEGETGQLSAALTPSNAETILTWSSSNNAVATVDQNGKVTAVKEGSANISVTTANNKTATAIVTVSNNIIEVTNITVAPATAQVTIGSTVNLTANVTPADATDKSVSWTSSDTKVATVSETGTVTGVAKGSVTITATASNGKTAAATITVVAPEPTNVSLSPSSLALKEGATGQLTATLTPSNAETLLTWSSSNNAVATVDRNGKVTALKEGSANISVTTANNKTATAIVTVSNTIIEVTNITVTPSTSQVTIGSTVNLSATVMPENATDKNVSWTSSDTRIATVSNNGTVTGMAKGTVTITATASNGKTAASTITVNAPEPVNVSLSPTSLDLKSGDTGELTAILTPANAETTLTWSSNNSAVATVDQNGKVTAVKEGRATITVTTANGKTATATVTVSNNIIEVTNITVTPTTAEVAIGSTVSLTATVSPGNATDKNVSWTSSDTRIATVSNNGMVTGVAKGTVTITATASNGNAATATITVVAPEPTSVSLSPSSLALKEGATGQLTATLTPANAETTLTWSSNHSAVATVDQNGKVTAVKEGNATITVTTSNGKTATATVTVSNNIIEVTNITVTPATAQIKTGETVSLTATVSPDNATDKSVSWRSSDTKIATVSNNGTVTGVAKGTATIIATASNGKTATATITVTAPDLLAVDLSPLTLKIDEGESAFFDVTFIPADAAAPLIWSSSDPQIAQVSADGEVTAVAPGMAIIYAASESGVTGAATVKVGDDGAASIIITPDNLLLEIDETAQLKVQTEPANSDTEITWSSRDTSVAVVSADGLVTAVGKGLTLIYARNAEGLTGVATVTVVDSKEVTSIEVLPGSLDIAVGGEAQLEAIVTPSISTAKITWISSDVSVAEVNSEGLVSAINPGAAIIYARSENGMTGFATVRVVSDEVLSVTIDPDLLTLELDETAQLTAIVDPANADTLLDWNSSDTTVATVDNTGMVKAVGPGYSFIYATSENGVTGIAVVRVSDPDADENTPGLGYGDNGVYVSNLRIREGDRLALFAERPEGFEANDWTYDWYLDDEPVAEGMYALVTAGQEGGWTGLVQSIAVEDYHVDIWNSLGDEVISEVPQVSVYARPLTPVELLRKGDGDSRSFIAMSSLTDADLAAAGYRFVFGYNDAEGVSHVIENSTLRYCHTTKDIYDNDSYRFWVYTTWTFADGATVTSGLKYLDGEIDESFDRSDFNFTRSNSLIGLEGETVTRIFTMDGHYVGNDASRLAPGIYIVTERRGNLLSTRKILKR